MHNKRKLWYYIQNYKFNSVFVKNFLLITLLMILPLGGISLIFYNNTKDMQEKEIHKSNINSLYKVKQIIDSIVKDVETVATNIALQDNTQVFMLSTEYNNIISDIYKKINDATRMYTLVYKYMDSIYLYSGKNDVLISNENATKLADSNDNNWYDAYKKIEKDTMILSRKKNNIYPYFISVIKPVLFKSEGKVGSVIVNIRIKELQNLIRGINDPVLQNTFIIDKDGTVLYSDNSDLITTSIENTDYLKDIISKDGDFEKPISIDGVSYIVSMIDSDYHEWKYISITPLEYYKSIIYDLGGFLATVIFLTLIFGFAMAILISFKSFQPISNIIEIIEQPEVDVKELLESSSKKNDEIKYIISNITQTAKTNSEMKKELEKRLVLLERAQFRALQAQINPHFLYNTLETISWLAVQLSNSKNKVSSALLMLAKIFRHTNDTESFLITINNEIEYAKLYSDILKLRYRDMFHIEWDIDANIMEYKTVKMFLQPIIENAVYHGIKPSGMNGVIKIKGRFADGGILFTVSNDGVEISQDMADEINSNLKYNYIMPNNHIGLANVNQRIKLICGEIYGVNIARGENGGTINSVFISLIES